MVVSAPSYLFEAFTKFIFMISKLYLLGLGLMILAGGGDRMAGPAYATLIEWAPWWVWGGSLVVFGVGGMFPLTLVRVMSLALAAAWFWVWWAALLVTSLYSLQSDMLICYAGDDCHALPKPGLTGIPTYFVIAVSYVGLAVASSMDWRERRSHDAHL